MATAIPTTTSRCGEPPEATPMLLPHARTPFERKVAAFASAVAQNLPTNCDILLDALGTSGIAMVVVRFDGKDGHGQVEGVAAYAPDGDTTDIPVVDLTVREVVFDNARTVPERRSLRGTIEIMAYTLLEHSHGEWSEGAGGSGELVFSAASRSVTLEYNQRVMTVRHHWQRFGDLSFPQNQESER
jgi:hypothetical protein